MTAKCKLEREGSTNDAKGPGHRQHKENSDWSRFPGRFFADGIHLSVGSADGVEVFVEFTVACNHVKDGYNGLVGMGVFALYPFSAVEVLYFGV